MIKTIILFLLALSTAHGKHQNLILSKIHEDETCIFLTFKNKNNWPLIVRCRSDRKTGQLGAMLWKIKKLNGEETRNAIVKISGTPPIGYYEYIFILPGESWVLNFPKKIVGVNSSTHIKEFELSMTVFHHSADRKHNKLSNKDSAISYNHWRAKNDEDQALIR